MRGANGEATAWMAPPRSATVSFIFFLDLISSLSDLESAISGSQILESQIVWDWDQGAQGCSESWHFPELLVFVVKSIDYQLHMSLYIGH
jgi:hypothetical protein